MSIPPFGYTIPTMSRVFRWILLDGSPAAAQLLNQPEMHPSDMLECTLKQDVTEPVKRWWQI